MRYTVFGATGGTGRQLVRQALAAGHQVTAVVRDPDRLPVREHERLEVVVAGVTDQEALRPAVAGRDAVLSALGAPTNKAVGIASAGTRAILGALDAEGVRRLVVVSAAPVGPPPDGEGPLYRLVLLPLVRRAFRDVYADLAVMENEIRAGGTDWTVVRPPRLTDGPPTSTYQTRFGGAVTGSHTVSRADVAQAMLALVEDPAAVRQVVGVAA
ncbi:NAD(P)-dependent oxidoreductase [Streptomyces yaizuensis]|uniref:NAD(P)H-binding protein n=1 Tax=Streptomyces yaizuensis TaxID=2989713 RepID=A0ABQ5NXW7_9ACTN|nr:SDR family oxidoreductase [Streptomyces sp. YSPA8]GLF95030.1 NAD(P)H-binding protein [Streptomyces sp. YSPA8]